MVNKAILVGRLGSDPEVKTTGSGKEVANFNIATDETFKDSSGERQKRTTWHRLTLWDKLAGIAKEYLHKGDMVYVEGRIQNREYETSAGERKTVTEIVVDTLRMLSSNRTEDVKPTTKAKHAAVSAEDIPF